MISPGSSASINDHCSQGGGDLALLDAPEESAEIAVKEFTEFLTSNNMK